MTSPLATEQIRSVGYTIIIEEVRANPKIARIRNKRHRRRMQKRQKQMIAWQALWDRFERQAIELKSGSEGIVPGNC